MSQVAGITLGITAVGLLLLLLYAVLRFSVVSSLRTKGARTRLRRPEPGGIAKVCGFSPPEELVDFYLRCPFVESMEFYLVDRSTAPVTCWAIGEFSPLTIQDVREQRAILGPKLKGIPIGSDMGKGGYYVSKNGAVMLFSPNVDQWTIQVAPNVKAFADFEPVDTPPVEPKN